MVILVLLGCGALALDGARLFVERHALQIIADSAALGAAQELPTADVNQVAAQATSVATRNGLDTGSRWLDAVTVAADRTAVTVTARSHIPFLLGSALGLTRSDIAARAVAQVSVPREIDNVIPWALDESIQLSYGASLPVKYGSDDNLYWDSGNFGAISITGTGAAVYEADLRLGTSATVGNDYVMQPGNLAGPTRAGLEWRLANTRADCADFTQVFEPTAAHPGWRFRNDACNPWSRAGRCGTTGLCSRRVVLVPLISGVVRGRATVALRAFAMGFVESPTCDDVRCAITMRFVQTRISSPQGLEAAAGWSLDNGIHFIRLVS
jgi:hypothetical protein